MKLWRKLAARWQRRRFEWEMAEEMRLHLELQVEKNRAAGMGQTEAQYAAHRAFGGVEQIKERCRDQRGAVKLELWLKEIGFAARALRRAPGFSFAVIATLALCLGPNTAILSALYRLVYKPLPFVASDRLVTISNIAERQGGAKRAASVVQATDFAEHADKFESFAYFVATNAIIGEDDAPEWANGMLVSTNLLSDLGVPLVVGRGFLEEEQQAGAGRVVVLSHRTWQKRFHGDPAIIGRQIRLNGENHLVVGVASPNFEQVFDDVEFFVPRTREANDDNPLARYTATVRLIGRLKPGVRPDEARAQLAVLERVFYEKVASSAVKKALDEGGYRIDVMEARTELAEPVRAPLWLLQGGAAMVLLLGCVNVASLLLARATAKRQELAIRHALGAGRGTLLRQMLAESGLLVGVAGGLGVGLALGMLRVMNAYLSTVVRHVPPIALEPPVLAIVAGAVGLMIVAMGAVPFVLAARAGLRPGESPQASAGRGSRRTIGALVVGQIALALVLLVGAGLLLRSFEKVMAVRPGFDAERVVHGRVTLPVARYKEPRDLLGVQQRLAGALTAIPGVEAVGLAADFPVKEKFNATSFRCREDAAAGGTGMIYPSAVSAGFFNAMGITLRAGRNFRDDDDLRTAPVAVVDESFARRFFPGREVVGMEFVFGTNPPAPGRPWIRIVGVVARANLAGLEGRDGWPFVYVPFNQQPAQGFSFVVRSARAEADLLSEIRAQMRAIDPGVPVYGAGALQGSLDALQGNRRAMLWLLGLFAALALALATVGLYGVLNYDVARRTREIGIRGAVGATRGQIVELVLRQGAARAAAGLVMGIAAAVLCTRALRSMLFDVSPADPVAFGGVVAVLLGVALLASWLPARRAAKVDPIVALRCE